MQNPKPYNLHLLCSRCEEGVLRALCSLGCAREASVHTIVVVDRPDAPNLDEVGAGQGMDSRPMICPLPG